MTRVSEKVDLKKKCWEMWRCEEEKAAEEKDQGERGGEKKKKMMMMMMKDLKREKERQLG